MLAIGAILHSKNKEHVKVKVAFDTKSNVSTSTPKATTTKSPSTPPKESISTPTEETTGLIQTPAGRRSARIAKRRKED